MIEYKMTRQAVEGAWAEVKGAPTREMELHPPAGEEWALHSFVHGRTEVVAVWSREKRLHAMSEVYSHAEGQPPTAVKTIADMPVPAK